MHDGESHARQFHSRLRSGHTTEAALTGLHPGEEFILQGPDGGTEYIFRDNSRCTVSPAGRSEIDESGWSP